MFIGHFAVGFAAKKIAPKTSLGTLFISAQLLDLIWPVALLLNLEHVKIDPGNTVLTPLDFCDYPWSHSLVMALVWSLLFGIVYFKFTKYRRGALAVGIGVVSHWILDLIVHRADLLISPFGNEKFGFGLWNFPISSIALELIIFAVSLFVYLRATQAKDRIGKYGLASLVIILLVIWIGNFEGPPPPNVTALAIVANAQWLFVWMAYWIDRHRRKSAR